MKHPIRKSIVCLLAMCVAVLLFALACYGFDKTGGGHDNSRDVARTLEAMFSAADGSVA